MKGIRKIVSIGAAAACLAVLLPHAAGAQRESPIVIGVGVGRFLQLKPLAAPETGDYKLEGVGVSVLAVDYWFTRWLGTRVSYAWLRTNMEEPEIPSSARMQMGHAAALLSPVRISRRVWPYFVLGAGIRRYDVNARIVTATDSWDIAPFQYRPAIVAGTGVTVRIGRIHFAPEAGVFMNTFRNEAGCQGCVERDRQMDMLLTLQLQLR